MAGTDATKAEALRRALRDSVLQQLDQHLAGPVAPGLYLVATPIGNLSDITLRALTTLANADTIYCEDTRQSQKLLDRYGIRRRLRVYQEHNAAEERPRILAALADGRSIALISDAGTPLVSDPGYKLVHEAVAAGIDVTAVPGPSAVLAALSVAGLPTDSFHFGGFLPSRQGQRCERIEGLRSVPGTLVLFEAPQRLGETLADLAALLGDRPAAVARELTKLHETVVRGSLGELAATFGSDEPKGECVIVVDAGEELAVDDSDIVSRLSEALRGLSTKDAADLVARQLGVPRKRVYALAIALRSGTKE
ncbi:MAG: 16S rRNA (cytidine(1402)-2'-O)-methyltransferase [Hyphomicrobiaceae bacterium]